jgi:D-arginine dehydrogenase
MTWDVAIVGAGMAGASLAAELAPHRRVLLLEGEDQPGYHATGRSAAFWVESYGGPGVQPLTTASGPMLEAGGFLHRRGALYLARSGDGALVEQFEQDFGASGVAFERLDRPALLQRLPGLRPDWVTGIFEPSCADIDVAGLHQAALATARRHGAVIATGSALTAAERASDGWRLTTTGGTHDAAILVNAAGAWADQVATIAGIRPVDIRPYRRTIAQVAVESLPVDVPLTLDIAGSFYFKSDSSGALWLSPHDETPCDPGDIAAEELDVAIAIDRFEHVVDWPVRRVTHRWAGLRSFSPDRLPVYGYDPADPCFFWFAGQGGFGIQTAPAAAQLGAALLLRQSPPPAVAHIDPAGYSPSRFR